MRTFASFLKLFSLKSVASSLNISFNLIAFYLSLTWIAAIVLTAIWCGYSFSQRHFRVLWPLKFLRFGAKITTTGLFIPMTSILLSIFNCHGSC